MHVQNRSRCACARDELRVLTVTRSASEEAIRSFAGSEVLEAKYYPEDEHFLLDFEPEALQRRCARGRRRVTDGAIWSAYGAS